MNDLKTKSWRKTTRKLLCYDIFTSLSWWITLFYIINYIFLINKYQRISTFYMRPEAFVFTSNAAYLSQKVGHPWPKEFPWAARVIYMPTSVYTILIHGPQIIAPALLPIGQLSEEAQKKPQINILKGWRLLPKEFSS